MFNYRACLEKYCSLREDDLEMIKVGIQHPKEYKLWLEFRDGIDDTWLIII